MKFLSKILGIKTRQNGHSPNPLNLVSLAVDLYEKTSPLSIFQFIVTRLRANAVASLTWGVYHEVGSNKVPVDAENPIAKAFWKPSPTLTTTELLSNIVFFLDVYGNAFIRVKRTSEGLELSFLHSAKMTKIGNDFVYENEYIPFSEVIHIREPILNWFGNNNDAAFVPKMILKNANEVIEAINRFLLRFVEKNGVPPIYFAGAVLTPEQQQNAVAQWNALYPDFPLRTFVESGEIKTIPMSISFNVDSLPIVVKYPMQLISSFYGVPLSKITGDNANYATALINDYTFWTTSIKPTALLIQDALTDYFRSVDSNILITFEDVDFSAFEMFKQSDNSKFSIVEKDYLYKDPNITWKLLDTLRKDIEKSYIEPLRKFWNAVKTQVMSLTIKSYTDIANSISVEDIISIAEMYLQEPINKNLKKAIKRAFEELGRQPLQNDFQLILSKAYYYTETQLEKWLNDWTQQLKNTIELSNNQQELQDNIEKVFKSLSQQRIQVQARTLATTTLNASLTETYSHFPEYDIVWLTQRDGKVRPAHILADGQVRKNGYFSVGGELLPFPASGVIPENNVNCRCYVRPIKRG